MAVRNVTGILGILVVFWMRLRQQRLDYGHQQGLRPLGVLNVDYDRDERVGGKVTTKFEQLLTCDKDTSLPYEVQSTGEVPERCAPKA